jgi:hypothetical protein
MLSRILLFQFFSDLLPDLLYYWYTALHWRNRSPHTERGRRGRPDQCLQTLPAVHSTVRYTRIAFLQREAERM